MRLSFQSLSVIAVAGALVGCGGGSAGESMTPVASKTPTDVAVPRAGKAVQIDCGDFFTCARLDDQSTRCWGRNKSGELGRGKGPEELRPVVVGRLEGATQVSLGGTFGCARFPDTDIRCWGSGRITGDGVMRDTAPPTSVVLPHDAVDVQANGVLACVRTEGASVRCWGSPANAKGLIPDVQTAVTRVAVASSHACVLLGEGAVRCWGEDEWFPRATKSFANPRISSAQEVVTGDAFACIVTKSGKAQCWGRNDSGLLGLAPDTVSRTAPVDVPGIASVKHLAAGDANACAITAAGEVTCWGANSHGELGVGRESASITPTVVSGLSHVEEVCLGSTHGCARDAEGTVSCWGQNAQGQVGDGSREAKLTPTKIHF